MRARRAASAFEQDAGVVFHEMRAGDEAQLAVGDGGGVPGRGDEGHVDRKDDDDHAGDEYEMRERIAEGAVLDHQYVTLRST